MLKYGKAKMKHQSLAVRLVKLEEWDALLENFPQHTVFHRRSWLETVSEVHQLKPHLIAVENANRLIAVWPNFTTRKGPFRVLGSPFPGTSTPYLGPLFGEDTDQSEAICAIQQNGAICGSFHACRTMDQPEEVNLEGFGFERTRRFETYLIDLMREESLLWSHMRCECRNRIRKARKSNVEVHQEYGTDFLRDFWPMALKVFAKDSRLPAYSKQFLELICRRLESDGHVLILSAFHERRRIGSLILPFDDHTMYYWAGASDARYNRFGLNNLLHWEALLKAQRRGLKRYDLVSTKGTKGEFKRKFRPDASEVCTHWERSASRLVRHARNVYERWARNRLRTSQSHGIPSRDS